MKNIKYIITILAFFLFLNIKGASADAYIIHLFYNTASKMLTFDKLVSDKVTLDKNISLSISEFTQSNAVSSGPYVLTFYDPTNNEIVSTQFDKQAGAFQLTVPYFSIASGLKIFDKVSKKEILSADLSTFATCNGNGICEFEKGETLLTCLEDCGTNNPVFSQQTAQTLKTTNNEIKDSKTGKVLLRGPVTQQPATPPSVKTAFYKTIYFYIVLVFLVIAVGGIVAYKKFKN